MKKSPLFLFLLLFFACSNEQVPKEKKQPLPNTPAAVVRAWQGYVDINEFEKAKALSTKETKAFLATLSDEEAIIHTEFIHIACQEKGNEANCNCVLKEGGEEYNDQFLLKKEKDQWLVDSPDDSSIGPSIEDMEDIMKVLEEQLEEENIDTKE